MAGRSSNKPGKSGKPSGKRARAGSGRSGGISGGRSRVVWASLITAMTSVGGLLWALDAGSGRASTGVALPALLATASEPSAASINVIYSTPTPVTRGQWDSIVIHHSGSGFGTPESIESQQRDRGIQSLGYHFLVGNGNGIGDGELHVGMRWLRQNPGAHAVGPRADQLNQRAIGICLVGNGERSGFTDGQIDRLVELVASLSVKLGIPRDRIYLQSDVADVRNPGRFFPTASFMERLEGEFRRNR